MPYDTLTRIAWFFFALLCVPIAFILLDYWSGTRKAKRNGIPLLSHGMRKSFQKACTYYNTLLALAVADAMQMWGIHTWDASYDGSIPLFPWLTAVGTLCVACIEIKSIMESADEKAKKQASELMELAKALASNSDPKAIAKEILTYITNGKQGNATDTDKDSEA